MRAGWVSLGECRCQLVSFGLRFRDVKLRNLYSGRVYEFIRAPFIDERPDANAKKIGLIHVSHVISRGLLLVVHPRTNREIAYAGERPAEALLISQCATHAADVHLVAPESRLPLC
jgi:hypothetical protein